MGWTYEQLEAEGLRPHELLCKCGHEGGDHHVVYWPLGIGIDECEFYGSNEVGGMKPTLTGRFFWRFLPPRYPRRPQRVRDFTRRYLLRGPWFVDHCHHFEYAGEGETG